MDTIETAEFALTGDRTLHGLLTPFGETGQNAGGLYVFSAGTVELPADPSSVVLKMAHDGAGAKVVLAKATSLAETDKGIEADFAIEPGLIGDRLLADYQAGRKHALSAEFADLVREGTKVVKAKLAGAATVVLGGFPSAAFFELGDPTAEPEPLTPDESGDIAIVATETPTTVTVTAAESNTTFTPQPEAPAESEFAVSVPNTVAAVATAPKPVTKDEVIALFSLAVSGSATEDQLKRLRSAGGFASSQSSMFALSDVKYDGTGSVQIDQRNPQWVGELYSGRSYQQKVIPLFSHADLTSKTAQGFRWTTKPAGGTWAGNKSNVPSNTPAAELDSVTAAFWAMGHDVAIEHQIFDDGFIAAYLALVPDAYALWADAKATTDILAEAVTSVADNPAGLTIGSGMSAIVDGAVAVVNANALPSFALVAPDVYKQVLKTPADNVLGYLNAALGLEEGTVASFTIRSSTALAAGSVLVGAREAVTIHELPSIVKVQAPDTVKGGIDFNAFGAEATFVHDPSALQLVTKYAA